MGALVDNKMQMLKRRHCARPVLCMRNDNPASSIPAATAALQLFLILIVIHSARAQESPIFDTRTTREFEHERASSLLVANYIQSNASAKYSSSWQPVWPPLAAGLSTVHANGAPVARNNNDRDDSQQSPVAQRMAPDELGRVKQALKPLAEFEARERPTRRLAHNWRSTDTRVLERRHSPTPQLDNTSLALAAGQHHHHHLSSGLGTINSLYLDQDEEQEKEQEQEQEQEREQEEPSKPLEQWPMSRVPPPEGNHKSVQVRQVAADGAAQAAAAAAAAASAQRALLAATAAAYEQAQENKRNESRRNAEACKDFSVGTQHENGGTFTSPNFPNAYPINLVCTRLIEAPPGHYIVLDFRDHFHIEEAGTDCDNDKIEIRNGSFGYSKILARYCGDKFPPPVRSTDQGMWLRFISDSSITHAGFKAVYRFEKQKKTKPMPPFECRFNVTSLPTISSVNGTADNHTGIHSGIIRNSEVPEKLIEYIKEHNVPLECIWNITVTPGWKIYLTFSAYEINKPNDCDSNFIEIYEENLTEENQTVKFCGTRTEPQQSKSNVFNVRHHALPNASGSRFEIIYTAFREKGSGRCDDREFDCDDGTCIHESLKCDGIKNCKYHYDEASETGPCHDNTEQPFFETEHMVIILIVFLTLVSGMCASIIVSCWGKIQERRRRKLEYNIRKSREASMEGQLNKLPELSGDEFGAHKAQQQQQQPPPPPPNALKRRVLAAPVAPAGDQHRQQLASNLHFAGQQQATPEAFVGLGQFSMANAMQQPQQLKANSQVIYGQQQWQQPALQQNVSEPQQFYGAARGVEQLARRQQLLQQHSDSNETSGSQASRFFAPPSKQANPILVQPSVAAASMPISVAKFNSMLQQQQQQRPLLDNSDQQHFRTDLHLNQLRRQLTLDAAHRNALTLSALHRPQYNEQQQQQQQRLMQFQRNPQAIYGAHPQANQLQLQQTLSSSVTCCNMLGDSLSETPLIGDLLSRAKMQQQRAAAGAPQMQMQQPQNSRMNELRAATLARQHQQQMSMNSPQQQQQQQQQSSSTTFPRSLSAHQLSRRTQLLQSQQQQQRAHHAPPPNHSLSYPHSCAQGSHQQESGESAALLPPPPPPPNLVKVRSSTSCAALPPGATAGLSQQQQHASQDSRRAAFRYSRLDPSQLTGDTLPDSDAMLMPLGASLQFDDLSTESDATFGMLIDSVGGVGASMMQAAGSQQMLLASQQQQRQANSAANAYQQQQQGGVSKAAPPRLLSHLNNCNFVRCQRAELTATGSQQLASNPALICDCGAFERANQQQQQQQQLMQQELQNSRAGYLSSMGTGEPMALCYSPGALLNGPTTGYAFAPAGQRFNRFRQQSSEMTADDDETDDEDDEPEENDDEPNGGDELEDEDEADLEVGQLAGGARFNNSRRQRLMVDDDGEEDEDVEEQDEDEESSDFMLQPRNSVINRKQRPTIVSRNEQPLKVAPDGQQQQPLQLGSQKGLSFQGSHTSLGCQSCTCRNATNTAGSQPKLNNATTMSDSQDSSICRSRNGETAANQSTMIEYRASATATSATSTDRQQAAAAELRLRKSTIMEPALQQQQQQQERTNSGQPTNVKEKCDNQIASSTTNTKN